MQSGNVGLISYRSCLTVDVSEGGDVFVSPFSFSAGASDLIYSVGRD
jgi:hypothetical protein